MYDQKEHTRVGFIQAFIGCLVPSCNLQYNHLVCSEDLNESNPVTVTMLPMEPPTKLQLPENLWQLCDNSNLTEETAPQK